VEHGVFIRLFLEPRATATLVDERLVPGLVEKDHLLRGRAVHIEVGNAYLRGDPRITASHHEDDRHLERWNALNDVQSRHFGPHALHAEAEGTHRGAQLQEQRLGRAPITMRDPAQ
jgi:hypothetical protein